MKRVLTLVLLVLMCASTWAQKNFTYIAPTVIVDPVYYAGDHTYFVDAVRGNDSYAGNCRSDFAWKTIANVNSFTFVAGDTILFKKGQTWREALLLYPNTGTAGSPIIISTYGSGEKPIIGAADQVTTWADSGSNIWAATLTTQCNLVAFSDTVGTLAASKATVNARSKWFWASNKLYVYAIGNPNLYYSGLGVEAAQRSSAVRLGWVSYITLDGLELKFSNAVSSGGTLLIDNGIGVKIKNCTIRDGNYASIYALNSGATTKLITLDSLLVYGCHQTGSSQSVIKFEGVDSSTISHCTISKSNDSTGADVVTLWNSDGNILEYNDIGGPAYNGVYARPTAHGNIIRYNYIHNVPGPGFQSREGSSYSKVYYNLFKECGLAIHFAGDTAQVGSKAWNNTIYATATNSNGIHASSTNTACEIKNNIVSVGAADALLVSAGSAAGTTVDHNVFINTSGNIVTYNGTNYALADFATYQAASGQDVHSTVSDPLFTTNGSNFMLQSGSPAIDGGIDVGLVRDYSGNTINVRHDLPDMGAYEYQGSVTRYKITVTAGANGTIAPPDSVYVKSGNNQMFTITPAGGCIIQQDSADGAAVGTGSTYTFTNVTAPHRFGATFALQRETGGLFVADAEDNSLVQFNRTVTDGTNTVAVSAASKNKGSYGYEFNWDGTNKQAYGIDSVGAQTDIYVRFYFKLSANYALAAWTAQHLLAIYDGSILLLQMRVAQNPTTAYQVQLIHPSYSEITGGFSSLTLDTWHYIEIRYVSHASTGGAEVWLDGSAVGSVLNINTSSHTANLVQFGGTATSVQVPSPGVLYIDDIKAATTAVGAYPY
jgi:hypothetical protein